MKTKFSKMNLCFSALLFLAMALSLAIPTQTVRAATITVCAVGCDHITIQAAVTAASSGDTINVAAGTYEEQVTITKSLDLMGAGEATTTILAPVTRAGTVTQGTTVHDYLLAAYAPSGTIDVRVEGFTLDVNGQNKTAGAARLDGVFFRDVKDTGGTMAGLFSSTVHNFAATPDYESWGLAAYGDSLLTLNDNDFSDYTRDGILVIGGNVTISNNIVTGSATPLNGISIQDVTAGTVTGNTVTGHTRSAPWAGVGILLWTSTGVPITGNHVNGNFYGINLGDASHDIAISGNELTNNIKRGITLDNSDNNTVSGNTITGPVGGTDDTAIGLANTSTGNIIGGPTPADGNTITMATSGTGNLYAIYMQSNVGTGSNTIRYNTITGGQRAVQFDGPPGITGLTTVSNNAISGQAFGGIVAYNNGDLVITNNTLTNTVRPIEFFGPVNVTVTGNTINGSTYAGINLGNFSGTATVSGNTIHDIATNQNGIWAQTSGAGLSITGNTIYNISGTGGGGGRGIQIDSSADGANIDGNEIYNITGFSGIVIDTGATGVKINNNYIHNNEQGIVANEQTAEFDGNRILNNRWGIDLNKAGATFILLHNQIAGNNTNPADSYGLSVWAGTAVAENNWWGAVSGPGPVGPGTGDQVSTNVDYSPWCTNAACTTFAPPFATTTTITADTPDPSLPNQTISVTATVAGLPAGAPTPTGTVTISGGVADCTITLASGTGSCNMTFATSGPKTITATYNPDTADFSTSSDTESHIITTKSIFTSQGSYDGWVLESYEYSSRGGVGSAIETTFNLGDFKNDRQFRAFLHFKTASLPNNAVITKVTLKIKKQGQVGTNPFNILGGLKVDMRKPFFGTTAGLVISDFQATTGKSAVATFGATPVSDWYSAVLNATGKAYINLTGSTQFRLSFATDDNDDNGADFMKFFSGDYATTSVRPRLIIEYYVP